jgi:predicted peptidase
MSAAAGRVQTRSYTFVEGNTKKKLDYALFVSSRVKKENKSPLVIALHGRNAPPESLARTLADAADAGGYIVAAPMGYSLEGWYGISTRVAADAKPANLAELSEQDVMNVLDLMRHDFNVDDRRTYLVGSSMGGAGALYLGTKHHEIWAAVGAAAPAAGGLPMTVLDTARELPMILVQGLDDDMVSPEATRRWAQHMRELGMTYEFDELPGAGHPDAIVLAAARIFAFFGKFTKQM